MAQLAIDFDRPVKPRDPHIDARDVPRASRQCRLILERLHKGPATNAELADISIKYTSRLSDCRRAGFVIEARRMGAGLWEYRLLESTE